jgi:hypothetical protein
VALKVLENGYDMSIVGNRALSKMFCPPFAELVINVHVEGLAGWWCFGKCIGDVAAKANVVNGS